MIFKSAFLQFKGYLSDNSSKFSLSMLFSTIILLYESSKCAEIFPYEPFLFSKSMMRVSRLSNCYKYSDVSSIVSDPVLYLFKMEVRRSMPLVHYS